MTWLFKMKIVQILLAILSLHIHALHSAEMTDTETVFPKVIRTDDDCHDFADTRNKYSRVSTNYSKESRSVQIGHELDIGRCVELCLTEGKILILTLREHVPAKVIRQMANRTGTLNVWLSFAVASGPNCEEVIQFHNQSIMPYNSTVLGFCEDEQGPQLGYRMEHLKNFLSTMNELRGPGDLYALLNGKVLLDSDRAFNWDAIKKRTKKIIVRREFEWFSRTTVLLVLDANKTMVVWDDVRDAATNPSSTFPLILLILLISFV